MAEKSSDGGGGGVVPWTAILAVLLATTSAVVYFSSLQTSRPDTPPDSRGQTLGYQDARARLWQDPFRAAADRESELHGVPERDPKHPAHEPESLKRQLLDRVRGKRVLILPVMISAGAYAELVEQRLRARVAVLEALGVCGYQPADGEHVGYVEIPWLWEWMRPEVASVHKILNPSPTSQMTLWEWMRREKLNVHKILHPSTQPTNPSLTVPYEWCDVASVKMAGTGKWQNKYDSVLVLWADEDAFADMPLSRLAALLAAVRPSPKELDKANVHLSTAIIGPRVSTTLHSLLIEADRGHCPELSEALEGVQMFAATPTAEERLLLQGVDASGGGHAGGGSTAQSVSRAKAGDVTAIAADDPD